MNAAKKIVVLGGGIAAEMAIYSLKNHPDQKKINIIQISNEFKYHPCSIHSTSFVCLRNTQRNLSELGDRILDSYQALKEFIPLHSPDGIERGEITHLSGIKDDSRLKFKRRYPNAHDNGQFYHQLEECYFFSPHRFMPWLKNQNKEIIRIQTDILKVEAKKVLTTQGEFEFDFVIIATGAYSTFFKEVYPEHQSIGKSVPISGSYFIFKKDYGEKSFGYALDESYAIYRGREKELLVGATTVRLDGSFDQYKQGIDEEERAELTERYEDLKNGLKSFIELPDLASAALDRGFRHRGYKRNPFWGPIDAEERIFTILGLYKNGYSLPFLAGPQIAEKILQKC